VKNNTHYESPEKRSAPPMRSKGASKERSMKASVHSAEPSAMELLVIIGIFGLMPEKKGKLAEDDAENCANQQEDDLMAGLRQASLVYGIARNFAEQHCEDERFSTEKTQVATEADAQRRKLADHWKKVGQSSSEMIDLQVAQQEMKFKTTLAYADFLRKFGYHLKIGQIQIPRDVALKVGQLRTEFTRQRNRERQRRYRGFQSVKITLTPEWILRYL
jgi:hypothetical protein